MCLTESPRAEVSSAPPGQNAQRSRPRVPLRFTGGYIRWPLRGRLRLHLAHSSQCGDLLRTREAGILAAGRQERPMLVGREASVKPGSATQRLQCADHVCGSACRLGQANVRPRPHSQLDRLVPVVGARGAAQSAMGFCVLPGRKPGPVNSCLTLSSQTDDSFLFRFPEIRTALVRV
jgi:hypothetical protein